MAANTIVTVVNSLATSEDKLAVLEELKVLLSSVSPQELRSVISNVPILLVFECLNTEDRNQEGVCCGVLERLLSALNPDSVLETLQEQFALWLERGSEPVQTLCVSQLLRVVESNAELLAASEEALLVAVVTQLQGKSDSLAHKAIDVLTRLGGTVAGVHRLFRGEVFHTLQTVMAKNDIVRYRVYQVVVEVCCMSSEAMTVCADSGLLHKLLSEIDSPDILLQVNCLELLSQLSCSNHGLLFLESRGVLTSLHTLLLSPPTPLLLPGLIKFFGGLARGRPKEVLSGFESFTGVVLGGVGGEGLGVDPNVRGLAMDTVAFIGRSAEGKAALDKQGRAMTECVRGLGEVMRNSPTSLRIRALNTTADLLHLPVAEQTEDLLRITEQWFHHLCPSPFQVIWGIAKQPFADLQVPALKVLQSVAVLPWGQRIMASTAGFPEFLLSRGGGGGGQEASKEAVEAKFQVACALKASPTVRETCGEALYVQLAEMCQQGPFFSPALPQSEVAFET